MKKQIFIGIAAALALAVTLGTIKFLQISAAIAEHASAKMPLEAVTTMTVEARSWAETLESVGSLIAVQGVVLRAEAEGNITKINFDSGAVVPAGSVLIEIDSAVEEAQLKAGQAERDKAHRAYSRAKGLVSESAASQATLESTEAAYRSAEAQVASLQAQIAKKRITAPFAGKLGVRRVNLGEFVNMGSEILPLFDLSAMHLDFSVPQRLVAQIKTGLPVNIQVEGLGEQTFQGKITSFDPQVDEHTRSTKVRALVENPGEVLRPGMFVRAEVGLSAGQNAIAIPASSIQYAPYGDTVFVVEQMKDEQGAAYTGVRSQTVELGPKRGNQVAVLKGLKSGDTVVTSGTFKLRPGVAISVHNELAPTNSTSPQPGDA